MFRPEKEPPPELSRYNRLGRDAWSPAGASVVPARVTDVVSSCRRLIYAKVGVMLGEGLCEDAGRVR